MSVPFITSQEDLEVFIRQWKEAKIVKKYVSLAEAIASLSTASPLVEARFCSAERWVIAQKGVPTVKEAMFHTAAQWRWSADTNTGNFVPAGAMAESRVAESRVQTRINTMCQFSYAVDSERDKSLWDALKAFEAHAKSCETFNLYGKKRRQWQDGSTAASAPTFVFSSQIFTRRPGGSERKNTVVPYDVHQWIADAVKENDKYMPNPLRPKMFELRGRVLENIKNCDPPYISRGDIVWVSFTVEFSIAPQSWSTTFTPYEIVRIGKVSQELLGGRPNAGSTADTAPEQGLAEGLVVDTNFDFPMFAAPPPTVAAAAAAIAPPVAPPSILDVPMAEVRNEVSFGPEDERMYASWPDDDEDLNEQDTREEHGERQERDTRDQQDDNESLISWPSSVPDNSAAVATGAEAFVDAEAVETVTLADLELSSATPRVTRGQKRKAEDEPGPSSTRASAARRGRSRVNPA